MRTNPRRNCKTDVSYKPGNESQEKAKLAGTSQEKPKAFRINKKNLKEKSAKSEEHESENGINNFIPIFLFLRNFII